MRNTFTAEDKITKKREYNEIMAKALKISRPGFAVLGLNNGCGRSRLGIILSRKIKGSVKRNRLKRVVRELFRLNRQLLPAEGADVVVIVYGDFLQDVDRGEKQAFLDAFAELTKALARRSDFFNPVAHLN